MKITAVPHTHPYLEETIKLLDRIGEGIILFGECSFEFSRWGVHMDWGIEELAHYTHGRPLSLVGTAHHMIYILKAGCVTCEKDTGGRYAVSYDPARDISALIRICAFGDEPCRDGERAQLLLIPSAGAHWERSIDSLLAVHKPLLRPDAHIVSSELMGDSFIYSIAEQHMVGEAIKHPFPNGAVITYVTYSF